MENKDKDVIKVCTNCWGSEPCWCGKPKYIEMWEFVYKAMKNCKGK